MPWEMDPSQVTPELVEKHGRPLMNEKEIASALNAETLLAPGSAKADETHYQRLGFQCVCNADLHAMNDDYKARLIMSAKGEKFLYKCIAMGIYIFFQVKAKWLVNHYTSPIWFVDAELFEKYSDEILKKHKNYKDIK